MVKRFHVHMPSGFFWGGGGLGVGAFKIVDANTKMNLSTETLVRYAAQNIEQTAS